MNGKSETCRDAETGILKSKTEIEKFSDLIEKHICDRQTQNLRLQDPLLGCVRFQDLGRICRDFLFFRGPFTTPYSNRPAMSIKTAQEHWDGSRI